MDVNGLYEILLTLVYITIPHGITYICVHGFLRMLILRLRKTYHKINAFEFTICGNEMGTKESNLSSKRVLRIKYKKKIENSRGVLPYSAVIRYQVDI